MGLGNSVGTGISEGDGMDELHTAEEPMATDDPNGIGISSGASIVCGRPDITVGTPVPLATSYVTSWGVSVGLVGISVGTGNIEGEARAELASAEDPSAEVPRTGTVSPKDAVSISTVGASVCGASIGDVAASVGSSVGTGISEGDKGAELDSGAEGPEASSSGAPGTSSSTSTISSSGKDVGDGLSVGTGGNDGDAGADSSSPEELCGTTISSS